MTRWGGTENPDDTKGLRGRAAGIRSGAGRRQGLGNAREPGDAQGLGDAQWWEKLGAGRSPDYLGSGRPGDRAT